MYVVWSCGVFTERNCDGMIGAISKKRKRGDDKRRIGYVSTNYDSTAQKVCAVLCTHIFPDPPRKKLRVNSFIIIMILTFFSSSTTADYVVPITI